MIDWIIKHLDVITDNIQRVKHTQKFQDVMYILGTISRGIGFVIMSFISIISFGVATLLLWCLFRG